LLTAACRDDGSIDVIDVLLHPDQCPKSVIPFADCPADLLFLAAEDDHNFQSVMFAKVAEKMMREAGKTNFEIVCVPGTGHICNSPYAPGLFKDKHPVMPGMFVYMGGSETPELHIKGQKEFYKRSLEFFQIKLKNGG
jgi:hypothetical protein